MVATSHINKKNPKSLLQNRDINSEIEAKDIVGGPWNQELEGITGTRDFIQVWADGA